MTENNRKQALVLTGSEVLANHHGMAPGMILTKDGRTYILLPGPPKDWNPCSNLKQSQSLVRCSMMVA